MIFRFKRKRQKNSSKKKLAKFIFYSRSFLIQDYLKWGEITPINGRKLGSFTPRRGGGSMSQSNSSLGSPWGRTWELGNGIFCVIFFEILTFKVRMNRFVAWLGFAILSGMRCCLT